MVHAVDVAPGADEGLQNVADALELVRGGSLGGADAPEELKVIELCDLSVDDAGSRGVERVQGPSDGRSVCGGDHLGVRVSVGAGACAVAGAVEMMEDANNVLNRIGVRHRRRMLTNPRKGL